MISIVIKSFNRPHYLDRCLKSILQNVEGVYEIKVLDDGTPEKYLNKLHVTYPQIKFLKSSKYDGKVKAIEENLEKGTEIDGFQIPTDLWYQTVSNAADYVLVIEDDVWFTASVNLDELVKNMKEFNIPLLKLGWLGNYADDQYLQLKKLNHFVTKAQPQRLFTSNKLIMDLFMYNKYKFFTILYKLKLVDNTTKRKYWAINSILMGLYRKDYWLAIWKDAKGRVDEKQQLRNAAVWYHHNKNSIFARTHQEYLKTTFKSSATGSYHEYGYHLDVNRMNYILNEAWFDDKLDPMENYPKDFSDEYIQSFLEKANHPDAQYAEWNKWADKFKEQYRNLGAEIE